MSLKACDVTGVTSGLTEMESGIRLEVSGRPRFLNLIMCPDLHVVLWSSLQVSPSPPTSPVAPPSAFGIFPISRVPSFCSSFTQDLSPLSSSAVCHPPRLVGQPPSSYLSGLSFTLSLSSHSLCSSGHKGSTCQSGKRFWQHSHFSLRGLRVPNGSGRVEEGRPGCGLAGRRPPHLRPGTAPTTQPTSSICPTHSLSSPHPQSRGGPLKFELSSWLQIEGAGPEDSGTYHCIARNNLGSASASAVLGILGAGETQQNKCRSRVSTPKEPEKQNNVYFVPLLFTSYRFDTCLYVSCFQFLYL